MSNQERRVREKRDIIKYSLRNLMGWLSVNLNYIEWDSHATTASPSINPIFSKFDMHTSCVYKLKIVKYAIDWVLWNTLDIYLQYTFKWICNHTWKTCVNIIQWFQLLVVFPWQYCEIVCGALAKHLQHWFNGDHLNNTHFPIYNKAISGMRATITAAHLTL